MKIMALQENLGLDARSDYSIFSAGERIPARGEAMHSIHVYTFLCGGSHMFRSYFEFPGQL
jgi:hypothetical protein